jgi:histidyl-tRNA synthetase
MQYRAVKGMNDILPEEVGRWHRLETAFRRLADLYCYSEVRTPVIEHTELFVRSIGETTDVVQKEMFTFERSQESLTLRPEGTAGAARAYVSHQVAAREPLTRWYYLGPMFRAEQPQRGRYRQFWQAGGEIFGDPGPACDAEMIDMLHRLLAEVGVADVQVCINSLGGPEARLRHRAALLEYLRPRQDELSPHARERLEVNPLRVLDSKDPRDRRLAAEAPSILQLLDRADRAHFDGLCAALDELGTPYVTDPGLVRGLDYYTRTLFEFNASTGELGAQNTLCGGGRYDEMVRSLGGPAVPAIGFAMGLERILLAMPPSPPARVPLCYLAPLGPRALRAALKLARDLRAAGAKADLDGRGRSLKSMLRRADSLGARLCIVLGEAELERGVVQLKDLEAHEQREVPLSEAPGTIAAALCAPRARAHPNCASGGSG